MIDLAKLVTDIYKYYAHIEPTKSPEKLLEHLSLTQEYAEKIIKNKNLINTLSILENKFELTEKSLKSLFEEMFYSAIYLHDLGKINKNFQIKKMKNENFSKSDAKNIAITEHSPLSARLYYKYFKPKIDELEKENKKKFWTILFINVYAIYKHHGYLGNFFKFKSDFKDRFSDKDNDFQDYEINLPDVAKITDNLLNNENRFRQSQEDCSKYYIYTKLLYSLIVSGDFYATTDYMNDVKTENFGLLTDKTTTGKTVLEDLITQYECTKIYTRIQDYKNNKRHNINDFTKVKDINILRCEMFIESEENLSKNLDKNLYFLEAPTGSGKTNTAVNLSLKLAKQNNLSKIFYIFPFNTLVEQTKDTLLNCFENAEMGNEIGIINSITPIPIIGNDKNEKIYEKALLDYQFINYPIVLTSHVQFFEWLFGTSRESNFAISQLANSVVVLDEIQSYKNSIWQEMTKMFNYYAEILNIKFVIMSATLPRLDEFLNNSNSIYIIKNREKYFNNPLFRNRVNVDFSLIENCKNTSQEEIFDKIIININDELSQSSNNKKILIEFIKKKTANKFYKYLHTHCNNEKSTNSELITGDDNIAKRKEIIDRVKTSKDTIILVSTQVIEAGVDIDMDLGYKDISILDAEEQFMGRINRSCKKKNCKVKFFNCDKSEGIYKNDIRSNKEMTLEDEEIRTYLKNKNFKNFYNKVIEKLKIKSTRNNTNNIENTLLSPLKNLDFTSIKSTMKLIDDKFQKYTVFLNTTEIINNKEVSGQNVWNEYKNLLQNSELKYAEKRIKLSKIMSQVNYFTYETYKKPTKSYNDELGHILYFENGEDYFTNGKFDPELLLGGENNYEFL